MKHLTIICKLKHDFTKQNLEKGDTVPLLVENGRVLVTKSEDINKSDSVSYLSNGEVIKIPIQYIDLPD